MACFLLALPEDVLPRWACPALRPTEALALFKTCRAMRAAPLTDPWREGWNAWLRARARAWAGARAMHTVPQARDAALLHRACALGDAEAACALLVFGGVDANASARGARAPLARAVCAGHAHLVRPLVARGARLEDANAAGFTALTLAAIQDEAGAVRALARAGAELDARDRNGDTPLHHAAYWGKLAAADALLAAGAACNPMNRQGRTPLFFARAFKRNAVVALLERSGVRGLGDT